MSTPPHIASLWPWHISHYRLFAALCGALLVITGCQTSESPDVDYTYPRKIGQRAYDPSPGEERPGLFGKDGLVLFGGKDRPTDDGASEGSGVGVNGFLWRAALDTVSDLPLASADPFGGVILTDWYSYPSATNERVKMQIYLLGRKLRSDGVNVTVFRQVKRRGDWQNTETSAQTATRIENRILEQARRLRVGALGG